MSKSRKRWVTVPADARIVRVVVPNAETPTRLGWKLDGRTFVVTP